MKLLRSTHVHNNDAEPVMSYRELSFIVDKNWAKFDHLSWLMHDELTINNLQT